MASENADLLANCWMHSGGTTPFRGAHGHRHWSPWLIQHRARKLSDVGFDAIGLFHDDLEHIIEHEFHEANDRHEALEELKSVLDRHGIDTVELEFLVEWVHEPDDPRRQAETETRQLLLDAAEVLDASHIKIGNLQGYTLSSDRLQEGFEDICAEFAEIGVDVGFEAFPADPNVDTLDDALAFVEGPDNGGLFLDLWHMVKMDIPFENIAALDAEDIVAVEFQDGYVDTEMDFMQETINLRKIPGEGEFDIEAFIDATKDAGFDGPWGLEILSEEFRRLSMNDAYLRAYEGGAEYV